MNAAYSARCRRTGEEAVQREANDPLRAIGLVRGLARLAQGEDVDLVAGIGQGVALAADPWVAGIDGVDDDRHTPHEPLTSSQSRSFSASESAARSTPRSAARRSTPR